MNTKKYICVLLGFIGFNMPLLAQTTSSTITCPATLTTSLGLPDYSDLNATAAWRTFNISPPDDWSSYKTNHYSNHQFKVQGHKVENRKLICFYGNAISSANGQAVKEMWFHSIEKSVPVNSRCHVVGNFSFTCKTQDTKSN